MARQANRTIFIACEGSGTEPNYFESIRDIVIGKDLDVMIYIDPMPKNEQEQQNELRAGAKRRELKKIKEEEEEELKKYEIAEQYRAQPTRYVRKAQMRLEDGSYDEAWAVFDRNGHPQHPAAFALADHEVNGKKVNIAFSSIAFEYWILLHFRQLYHAFSKSQCRLGDVIFNCGSHVHPDDCQGNLCVCGYLKAHNLLPDYEKGMNGLYHVLAAHLPTAISNAHWLRKQIPIPDRGRPLYELNPYINIDHVVYTLLHLPSELMWLTGPVRIDHIIFRIERDGNIVRISMTNTQPNRPFVLNANRFLLSDSSGVLHPINERQIIRDAEPQPIEFDLNTLPDFSPVYILCNKVGNEYYIMDL